MDNLVNYMDNDYSVLLGAVKCLPMPSCDRDAVTQTIHQQCSKIKVMVPLKQFFTHIDWLTNYNHFIGISFYCTDRQQSTDQFGACQ